MKNSIIIGTIALLIGGALGHYLVAPKEITKIQTVEKEVVKHDIKTITIKAPDGTTTTTTVDNSVETVDKKDTAITSKATEKNRLFSLAAKHNNIDGNIYEATLQFRSIGPVFIGGSINTANQIGVAVTYEF